MQLSCASYHEAYRGSRGLAPHIVNIGTWWSFMPWLLYLQAKICQNPLN